MSEADIQAGILRRCCVGAVRLFRNNVGRAWMGKSERITRAGLVMLNPGDVVVRNARAVVYGLHEGSADLIGWRSVVVTEADVGRRLAVFASVEVKRPGRTLDPDQETWAVAVDKAGGLAIVAHSPDEAAAGLDIP